MPLEQHKRRIMATGEQPFDAIPKLVCNGVGHDVAIRLTQRMGQEQGRVNGTRIENKPDRAPPHWLSPLVELKASNTESKSCLRKGSTHSMVRFHRAERPMLWVDPFRPGSDFLGNRQSCLSSAFIILPSSSPPTAPPFCILHSAFCIHLWLPLHFRPARHRQARGFGPVCCEKWFAAFPCWSISARNGFEPTRQPRAGGSYDTFSVSPGRPQAPSRRITGQPVANH